MDDNKFYTPNWGLHYEPIYGSTDFSSGSAIIPENSSTVYSRIQAFDQFIPTDENEKEKYLKKIREIYIKELENSIKRDGEIYKSQKGFGLWIFIVTVFITLSGIGFSISQFIIACNTGNFAELTTLEIQNAVNFVLKTSSIGALVLTLSLLFFFLFLNFVYKPNSKRTDLFRKIKDAIELTK